MGPRLDLVIVGGGPAGISTALHVLHHAPGLAERMVVLERDRYPRDKYCAGGVGARADRCLDEIGVSVDVPAVRIHAMSLRFGAGSVFVREPDIGRVVRRIEFDHAFAKEAIARGIAVREGVGVTGVESAAGGVRVHTESGEVLEARAVVGADGVGGAVRRTTGFSRGRLRAQVIELDTEIVDGDPPGDALHFDLSDPALHGYVWDFPTLVDGHPLVCRGIYYIQERGAIDVRARLGAYLASKGLSMDRYRLKHFAERGFEPGEPISRPHVLLVGEAAGIDIATGEGIPQAIQFGALAGRYLTAAFREGDFRFRDWLERVRGDRVGRGLRWRHAGFRAFYGPERKATEALLVNAPEFVRHATRDFAGKPVAPLVLGRAAAELARHLIVTGPGLVARMFRRFSTSGSDPTVR